jgi:hypothetical protein
VASSLASSSLKLAASDKFGYANCASNRPESIAAPRLPVRRGTLAQSLRLYLRLTRFKNMVSQISPGPNAANATTVTPQIILRREMMARTIKPTP